jgi:hypothetical protein
MLAFEILREETVDQDPAKILDNLPRKIGTSFGFRVQTRRVHPW